MITVFASAAPKSFEGDGVGLETSIHKCGLNAAHLTELSEEVGVAIADRKFKSGESVQ